MDLKDPKNIAELLKVQRDVLRSYVRYIRKLVRERYKNAALLTYWLRDYLQYLKRENSFVPSMTYRRGQIVYVNFGYRIGRELGGCHYAIVMDVKNSRNSSLITVVPMKSKRDKVTTYSRIYHVYLSENVRAVLTRKAVDILQEQVDGFAERIETSDKKRVIAKYKRNIRQAMEIYAYAKNKLNHSSVADVGQICNVSKIRIVHPAQNSDVLAGVILPDDCMQRIEKRIAQLYFPSLDRESNMG